MDTADTDTMDIKDTRDGRLEPMVVLSVSAASFGFVVTQLDVTIVNVALPSIGTALVSPLSALQWIVDGYTLGFAALLLSAGALCDRFGARRVYLWGLVSFGLISACCGLAQTTAQLVGARIVQGFSATLLVPPSLALINHCCGNDGRLRAKAIAIWTAAGGVSIAAGPVVGGLLSSLLTWRAIFLVNLPICLIGCLLTLKCAETPTSERGRFDWLGQALAIGSMASLLGGIIEVGAKGPQDRFAIGLCGFAVLSFALFLAVESRASHPMLLLGIFRVKGFRPAVLFGVAANLAYYGIIFVLSLYLQQVMAYSPSMAGLAFMPLTATFIVSNIVSGYVMARHGCRLPMVAGASIASVGYALLLTLGSESRVSSMMLPFILIPAGMGLGVPAMTTAILASVLKESSGTASGVLNAARQAGGAVGVAAYGALIATPLGVVGGLHVASIVSAVLLAAAALLAWGGVRTGDEGLPAAASRP